MGETMTTTTSDLPLRWRAEMNEASAPAEARSINLATVGWWGCVIVAVVVYLATMRASFVPVITHPDANGYFAQGSLIAESHSSIRRVTNNAEYVGMHWLLASDGSYVCRYPPGYPLLIAAVYETLGPNASLWIDPVLGGLTLLGVGLVAARLAGRGWAIAAMLLLAINPAFLKHGLEHIAHLPVACCLVWGIWFLLRWSGRGRLRDVFAAGLVLGSIPSIRYADAVVALGVAAFLLAHVARFRNIWQHSLVAIAGAAVPIVPLMLRNKLVFGSFFSTGYSLTHESTGFSWDNFKDHWLGYLQMLGSGGLGLPFFLGVIGVAWMFATRGTRAVAAMLTLAVVPFLAVYMAYYWSQGIGASTDGGGMRFLVPIVPLFVIASVWTLRQMTLDRGRAAGVTVAVSVIALQSLLSIPVAWDALRQDRDAKEASARATRGLEATAARGDVVIAPSGLLQHLDFVHHWTLVDASIVSGRGGFAGPGMGPPGGNLRGAGDDGPSPQQREKQVARANAYPRDETARAKAFMSDVRELAGKRTIWLVGTRDEIDDLLPKVDDADYKIVWRETLPKRPEPSERRGGFNGGRRGNFRGGPGGGGPGGGGGMMGWRVSGGEEIVIARVMLPARRAVATVSP